MKYLIVSLSGPFDAPTASPEVPQLTYFGRFDDVSTAVLALADIRTKNPAFEFALMAVLS